MRQMNTQTNAEDRMYGGYNPLGRRLYITDDERRAFLKAARREPGHIQLFCTVIALTGCRLTEACRLTPANIDLSLNLIVFETLKRRQRGVFRHVPIPPDLSRTLALAVSSRDPGRLWPISRTTGWRWIKRVMARAGIVGPQATTKGLRHGFGATATHADVPLSLIQRWLGHARLSTTLIYTTTFGPEERAFAERLWAASSRG